MDTDCVVRLGLHLGEATSTDHVCDAASDGFANGNVIVGEGSVDFVGNDVDGFEWERGAEGDEDEDDEDADYEVDEDDEDEVGPGYVISRPGPPRMLLSFADELTELDLNKLEEDEEDTDEGEGDGHSEKKNDRGHDHDATPGQHIATHHDPKQLILAIVRLPSGETEWALFKREPPPSPPIPGTPYLVKRELSPSPPIPDTPPPLPTPPPTPRSESLPGVRRGGRLRRLRALPENCSGTPFYRRLPRTDTRVDSTIVGVSNTSVPRRRNRSVYDEDDECSESPPMLRSNKRRL